MPGWGAMFNYPISEIEVSELYLEKFSDVAVTAFQMNLGRQEQLIIDVRDGSVTDLDFEEFEATKARLLADQDAVEKAVSVGWSMMGMSVWASRGRVGDQQLTDMAKLQEHMRERHLDEMIEAIKRQPTTF
jgi:hypothetical protein